MAVRLRLPTPQCAPNFAFLMAADASRALWRVDGVTSVEVTLEDHYTGAEINATVNAGGSFSDAFPGETRGELDALRALFQRKALLARQSGLLSEVPRRLGDLHGPEADRCRELRRALGIDASDDAAPFVTGDGDVPWTADRCSLPADGVDDGAVPGDQRRHVPRSAGGFDTEEEVAA